MPSFGSIFHDTSTFRARCGDALNTTGAREDIGPGCPERIDLPFLKDWVWTYPTRARPEHAKIMAGLPAGVLGITLRSRAEVATFASDLPHALTVTQDHSSLK
jgi:hypothetical protein